MSVERNFWKVTRWARAARFWLFLLLAVVAWLGFGLDAHAACTPYGTDGAVCGNQQEAFSWANAMGPAVGVVSHGCTQSQPSKGPPHKVFPPTGSGTSSGQYEVVALCSGGREGNYIGSALWSGSCPADKPWDPITNSCAAECGSRPPLTKVAARGSDQICSDGCSFEQYNPGGITVCIGAGPQMYCGAKEWRPTGQTCTLSDTSEPWDPDSSTCRTIPGAAFNECVQPDGTHCVTGEKGTRMCFQPGKTGELMPATGVEGANKGPANSNPPPPNGMENPELKGSTTTTINNSTTTTNLYNGTGNTGGQHNTGPGGTGNGGGSGNGSGSGDGDGDGDDDGPGGVGPGVGTLYEASGETVAGHVSAHVARMQNAPIIAAATGFLSLNLGGSCPVFSFSFMGREVVVDFFCRQEFAQVYVWVGYFMLFIFAWAAFRIGVLD